MTVEAHRKQSRENALHLAALVSALTILLAPQVVTPCGGRVTFESTRHHCNETFVAVSALGLSASVAMIASWWSRKPRLRVILQGIGAGLTAAVLSLPRPWALGICRRADMACHRTELATAIPSVVLLLITFGLFAGAMQQVIRVRMDRLREPDPWDEGEIETKTVKAPTAGRLE